MKDDALGAEQTLMRIQHAVFMYDAKFAFFSLSMGWNGQL